MAVVAARTVALDGAVGHLIDVQADVSPGQVGTTLVGRPDAALSESRDRCRMAIINSGFSWPATKRVTVLLSPADLPKRGTHFDLAIALAVLAAATGGATDDDAAASTAEEVADAARKRQQFLDSLPHTAFLGELTLAGGLRSVPGVLPMVLAAADRGVGCVVVPEPQVHEAQMVPDMSVVGARSLAQVVAHLRGEDMPDAPPVAEMSGSRLLAWRGRERLEEVDLADLRGLGEAKYAVEVAAAGGHAILLSGSKGAGKTSLAERIPGLLPDLLPDEALELTALHSLAGALEPQDDLIMRPPWSAPHHDASKASIVGGGSGQVRPGEISRAHGGVLFLDEWPLFRADIIDALRQPLESGEVTIARREESVTLPARTLLVLACNPCPCGEFSTVPGANRCTCRPQALRDYRARTSGPIADRIDITRHVGPLRPHEHDPFTPAETTAEVRARVEAVRARQHERYADCGWRLNAHVPGPVLRDRWPLAPRAQRVVDDALYAGRLSSRGAVRVQRVAWTVSDMLAVRRGHDVVPDLEEVDVALRLRAGDPLLGRTIARAVS